MPPQGLEFTEDCRKQQHKKIFFSGKQETGLLRSLRLKTFLVPLVRINIQHKSLFHRYKEES
jgi:hypothetical protein